MRMGLVNRERLRRIDKRCGQFAGMVDAESGVEELLLSLGKRLRTFRLWFVILHGSRLRFCS